MSRRLGDGVIPNICKYTEETEIPSLYSLWAAIGGVSALLGRRCCVEFGYKTIYPNTFIVLVAESGACRKSSAIMLVSDMLREVRPSVNLLSQKMTPEALIDALSEQKIEDDDIVITAEGTAIADELTTLIDKNAIKSGLTSLLTNLYDGGDFEYRTRSRKVEHIRNPCLSVLGGTTVHWIKESLSVSSIIGGFTARIIFIYLSQRDKNVAWPTLSIDNMKRREDIIHDMNCIAKLQGPFNLNEDARSLFETEYSSFSATSELTKTPLTDGYASRRHINLLKVAMAISASRTDSLEIDLGDMKVAIKALRAAEVNLPKVMRAISTTDVGDLCEFVIDIVRQKKVITRPDLIKATRHKVTVSQLEDIMTGICEGGAVDIDVRDGRKIYIWKGND